MTSILLLRYRTENKQGCGEYTEPNLTVQYHSQNRSVQSSLSYGPACFHSVFHLYNFALTSVVRALPEEGTNPMMSAPAVLMYRPSPSGLFGIWETGKSIAGAGGFGSGLSSIGLGAAMPAK